MTIEQIQQQVEEYLGNAQIGEAIDFLIGEAKQKGLHSAKQNALLLRAQFFSLKQKYEIRGMLQHQEYQVEANRIAAGVLALAQDGLVEEAQPSIPGWKMRWVVAIGFLLLVGSGYWLLREKPAISQPPTNVMLQTNPTPTIVTPPDSIQKEEKKEKLVEKTTPTDNGPVSKEHHTEPPPPEESISIVIAIDDCWNGAEILVDGKEKGTVVAISKKVKVRKKNDEYKIVLRKNGVFSQIQYYSSEDDSSVNFTCQ